MPSTTLHRPAADLYGRRACRWFTFALLEASGTGLRGAAPPGVGLRLIVICYGGPLGVLA